MLTKRDERNITETHERCTQVPSLTGLTSRTPLPTPTHEPSLALHYSLYSPLWILNVLVSQRTICASSLCITTATRLAPPHPRWPSHCPCSRPRMRAQIPLLSTVEAVGGWSQSNGLRQGTRDQLVAANQQHWCSPTAENNSSTNTTFLLTSLQEQLVLTLSCLVPAPPQIPHYLACLCTLATLHAWQGEFVALVCLRHSSLIHCPGWRNNDRTIVHIHRFVVHTCKIVATCSYAHMRTMCGQLALYYYDHVILIMGVTVMTKRFCLMRKRKKQVWTCIFFWQGCPMR